MEESMTVIQFPTGERQEDFPAYSVHVYPTPGGFDWALDNGDDTIPPDEDQVAADLAAIALSLRPPKRSFLERLVYLFTGETE
jgi:hypothetical protein